MISVGPITSTDIHTFLLYSELQSRTSRVYGIGTEYSR